MSKTNTGMEVVYVIGPYRNESHFIIAQNIQRAREAAEKLWTRGYAVICPHMNTAFFGGVCEEDCFLNGGIELLSRCDYYYTVEGWENSMGSVLEVEYAESRGIQKLIFMEA